MPTIYGAWTPNASTNQRMRLIINYEVTLNSPTAATVTGTVQVGAGYSFTDSSNTFAWSGNLLGSGSTSKSINVATGGTQQIHSFSKGITRTSADQSFTLGFSLTGIEYVGISRTASVSTTITISSGAAPAPPSSVTMTRSTDTSGSISWTAVSGALLYGVGLSTDGNNYTWLDWYSASPAAVTLQANRSYAASVFTRSSSGDSGPRYSSTIYTTPAAVTNVTFVQTGASTGRVDWKINARHSGRQALQYTLNDGPWTSYHNNLAGATNSLNVSGLAQGRAYRWRVVTYTPAPALSSTSGASPSVTMASPPPAPSTVQATLNSNGTWNVTWSAGSSPSSWRIERSINGGGWSAVASNLPGTARSASVAKAADNAWVRFRVIGVNIAGNGAPGQSPDYYSKPAAATGLKVTRTTTGVSFEWTNNAAYSSRINLLGASRTPGGAWSTPSSLTGHTNLSATTTQRTITGLDTSKEWRFYVETVATPPTQATRSAASAAVALLQKPGKPTWLEPVGTIPTGPSTWSWRHNALDSSEQTAYELQYRVVGNPAFTTVSGTTGQSRSMTLTNNLWETRVRTKGQHPDWSDWSDLNVVRVANRPNLNILSPTPATLVTSNRPRYYWSYSDPDGAGQVSWRSELIYGGQVLENQTGTTQSSSAFNTMLENNTDYEIRLWATSGTGLESLVATTTFTTEFQKPPRAVLLATWSDETGVVQLTVGEFETGTGFGTFDHARIERWEDDRWVIIGDGMGADSSVTDWRAPLNQHLYYRLVTVSDLDVENAVESVEIIETCAEGGDCSDARGGIRVYTESLSVWVSWDGRGFSIECEVHAHAELGQVSVAHTLKGRRLPVPVYDLDLDSGRVLNVTGIRPHTSLNAIEMMLREAQRQTIYWRDLHGRAFPARIFNVTTHDEIYRHAGVEFSVMELEDDPLPVAGGDDDD